MKTKHLIIVFALLTSMIIGFVLLAQPAGDSLAANNPNPGMPGGTGAGAPASGGGQDHIAPGPGVSFHNGGDGAAGSGSGSGGIAPGPRVTFHNGGDGAAGSGSGSGGIAPGPRVAFHSGGAGASGSGSGSGGIAPGPKVSSL